MSINSIVSHLAPRHLDDFLAIALLKNKNTQAEIEYVHPQKVPQHYIGDKEVCLVDVGGIYDPQKNNYDHHQSKNIASSIVLVLKEQNKLYNHPVIQTIDTIDREGFASAKEKFGLQSNKEIDKKRKMILMCDLKNINVCKTVVDVLDKITLPNSFMSKMDFDGFINDLYTTLDNKKLMQEVKKKIEKEEEELQEKIAKASIWQTPFSRYTVVYSTESFAPFHSKVFDEVKADIIIEKNAMNPNHASIIKNTKNKNTQAIDLNKVFEFYNKVFLHNTGFIAVVDEKAEKIQISKLLMRLLPANYEENLNLKDGKKRRCLI